VRCWRKKKKVAHRYITSKLQFVYVDVLSPRMRATAMVDVRNEKMNYLCLSILAALARHWGKPLRIGG
jgi:hypothetical protein